MDDATGAVAATIDTTNADATTTDIESSILPCNYVKYVECEKNVLKYVMIVNMHSLYIIDNSS